MGLTPKLLEDLRGLKYNPSAYTLNERARLWEIASEVAYDTGDTVGLEYLLDDSVTQEEAKCLHLLSQKSFEYRLFALHAVLCYGRQLPPYPINQRASKVARFLSAGMVPRGQSILRQTVNRDSFSLQELGDDNVLSRMDLPRTALKWSPEIVETPLVAGLQTVLIQDPYGGLGNKLRVSLYQIRRAVPIPLRELVLALDLSPGVRFHLLSGVFSPETDCCINELSLLDELMWGAITLGLLQALKDPERYFRAEKANWQDFWQEELWCLNKLLQMIRRKQVARAQKPEECPTLWALWWRQTFLDLIMVNDPKWDFSRRHSEEELGNTE